MNETRGLWRGKRFYNGEWALGCLIRDSSKAMIVVLDNKTNRMSGTAVDPSTLGECTGLTDKNGKLIFEGDIVKVGNYTGNLKIEYGVVRYDNKSAVFFVKYSNMENYLDEEDEMEVIGNIHDNPELLKTATGEDNGNAAQCGLLPAT